MYWFCQISKWIRQRYTCVPHPEPSLSDGTWDLWFLLQHANTWLYHVNLIIIFFFFEAYVITEYWVEFPVPSPLNSLHSYCPDFLLLCLVICSEFALFFVLFYLHQHFWINFINSPIKIIPFLIHHIYLFSYYLVPRLFQILKLYGWKMW